MEMMNTLVNDKYLIKYLIGEGLLSKVYSAEEQDTGKICVVKILKNDSITDRIEDIIRFKNECRIISGLSHNNIIKIFEAGEHLQYYYLVMEYASGTSLEKMINDNFKFNLYQIMEIIRQIAKALAYIHENEIIHRDLKPGNIMVNVKKNIIEVKLIDFGLAMMKQFSKISDNQLIVGTFSYMSPEQCGIIKRDIDERSDLYSLGITFYRLLTGILPFSGHDINEIIHQQIAKEPKFPDSDNDNIPEILKNIVIKLLEKEQEERYQSAKGLLHDLDRVSDGETDFVIGINDKKIKLNYKTSLTGREEELNRVKTMFESAMSGKGVLCMVSGESGCGKTRLIEELKAYAEEKKTLCIEGKNRINSNKPPYEIIKYALSCYLNVFDKYSIERKESLMNQFKGSINNMGRILMDFDPIMECIFRNSPSLVRLDSEKENQRFLMTISGFIQNIGKYENGLVIFIDDLQWADEGTMQILSKTVQDIYNFPLLVVCSCNINEIKENNHVKMFIDDCLANQLSFVEIKMGKFDAVRLNRLVAKLLYSDEEKLQDISGLIYLKSGGNIFLTIEILRQLVDEEILYLKDNTWEIDRNKLDKMNISNHIVDLIMKRISLLDKTDIDILFNAAVIGKDFNINLLFDICTGFTKQAVVNTIDKAIKLQLVESGRLEKDKYQFIHDRVHKAFNEKIGGDNEKNIHLKIAEIIEGRKDRENFIFDLAYHYNKAQDRDNILRYFYPAALKAKLNYANETAIKYLETIIELLKEKNEIYGDLWEKSINELSELYLLTANTDDAIKFYNILLELKTVRSDKADIFEKISYAYYRKGDFVNCEKYGESGLKLLGERIYFSRLSLFLSVIKEILLFVLINRFRSNYSVHKQSAVKNKYKRIIMIYFSLGSSYVFTNILKLMRVSLKMLNISKSRIGFSKELARSLFGFGALCSAIPMFRLSRRFFERTIGCYKKMKDKWGIAITNQQLAYLYSYSGDFSKSISCFNLALNIFNKIGDLKEYSMTLNGLGYCYYLLADYDKFKHYADMMHNLSNKINDYYTLFVSNCFHIMYFIETGDFKNAENNILKLMNQLKDNQVMFLKFMVNLQYGKLKLLKNEYYDADKYFNEALRLNKNNNFFQAYVVDLYPCMAELLLAVYTEGKRNGSREIGKKPDMIERQKLKKIKKACLLSLKKTKYWPAQYGSALRAYARYLALSDRISGARKYFIKCLQYFERTGRKYELAKSLYEYSIFLKHTGENIKSQSKIEAAYGIFIELNSRFYQEKINRILKIGESPSAIERMIDRQKLSMIIKLSQDISAVLSIDELLVMIIQKSIEVIGAKRGYLFLYNDNEDRLDLKSVVGESDNEKKQFSMNMVNNVFYKKEIIITTDAEHDEMYNIYDSVRLNHLKSVICMPMKIRDKIIGVCYFDNPLTRGVFTKESADLLEVFISQASITVENALLYQNLEIKVKERTRELNDAKEIADRANTAKSDFLAKISHDIRTPLHAIMGFSELIKKHLKEEKTRDFNKRIINESEHLLDLINQLLDMSKIEAGKLELQNVKFNLLDLISAVTKTIEVLCGAKNLYFRVNIDKNIHYGLAGDPLRLHQILINLIGNGVKFTASGGVTFDIDTVEQDEKEIKLIFTITDTGMGIPDDIKSSIFAKYVQGKTVMNSEYKGTGLGTTISKQLVDLMGGEIDFESIEKKGTKFWFVLKFQKSLQPAEKNIIDDSNEDNFNGFFTGLSVLLAEDNKINQEIVSEYLNRTGCTIAVADNGALALELVKKNNYDLILMDIEMPEMNGFEATKRIRILDNNIVIIGMTANAFSDDINRCLSVGMNDVITKPVRKIDFIKKIYSFSTDRIPVLKNDKNDNKLKNMGNDAEDKLHSGMNAINYEKLLSEFNNNKEFINELLKEFVESAGNSLEKMIEFYNMRKYDEFKFEAHKIKGVSYNMTAQKIGRIAEQLELMGRKQNFIDFEDSLKAYKNGLEEIQEFLGSL